MNVSWFANDKGVYPEAYDSFKISNTSVDPDKTDRLWTY